MTESESAETSRRREDLREKLPEAVRIAARIPILEAAISAAKRTTELDPALAPAQRLLEAEHSQILDKLRDGFTVDAIHSKLRQTAPAALRIRHAAIAEVCGDLLAAIRTRRKEFQLTGAPSEASDAPIAVLVELAESLAAESAALFAKMLEV